MSNIYKRFRFPSGIVQYTVWPHYRINFSHRDIEDLLAERGIIVTYESIRIWCNRSGPKYATRLKRKQGAGLSLLHARNQSGLGYRSQASDRDQSDISAPDYRGRELRLPVHWPQDSRWIRPPGFVPTRSGRSPEF